MQGTGTAADKAMAVGVDWGRGDSTSCYVASVAMARAALATSGGDVYGIAYSPVDRATAAESAIRCFTDDSWDREPRVTETPKRPCVWLPVIQPEAKPLRDRKRLLARRRK